eukprot:6471886-Amphidinium_carterae.2
MTKGWLEGPLSDAQLESMVGAGWVPSHRFGLRKNGKVRVTDDFSASLINSTVMVREKLVLQDIDAYLLIVRDWAQLFEMRGCGKWSAVSSNRSFWEAVSASAQHIASLLCPTLRCRVVWLERFLMYALPIWCNAAATGSVYGFCRVAGALRRIHKVIIGADV